MDGDIWDFLTVFFSDGEFGVFDNIEWPDRDGELGNNWEQFRCQL